MDDEWTGGCGPCNDAQANENENEVMGIKCQWVDREQSRRRQWTNLYTDETELWMLGLINSNEDTVEAGMEWDGSDDAGAPGLSRKNQKGVSE